MIIGSTISHYKIVEKLGEGGMGVVYKAEDTKLERTVALKFLAQHLLDDDEAKQRFLREAKAAAALHHPNVCPVHEIDDVDGKTFIAMAFLEGEPLEDRIAEGPLSLKDALDIARQVAEGLQTAHSKGVFHRDIKPANIIVSPEGRATIMDFGLARLTEASRLTKVDTAMGTVAYMSPEQAQGMEVDGRTDIWALGCVIYEMVSGQRPFQGQYDQALLYEIVHEDPTALTGLRTGVPVELEFVVGKCLEKDADSRYQNASDAAVDLRNLQDKLRSGRSTILQAAQMAGAVPATVMAEHTVNPVEALPPGAVIVQQKSQRALQGVAALSTLALVGVLAFLFAQPPEETVERQVTRFSFSHEGAQDVAMISPDGKHVVYAVESGGQSNLWVRSLVNESARQLAGTDGARGGAFWSPDSLTISFPTDEDLKRVSLDGGNPVTLCPLPTTGGQFAFFGGSWSPDGQRIVFSSGAKLYEIAAVGGEPKQISDPAEAKRLLTPSFLPSDRGREAIVYTAAYSNGDPMLMVMDLESGDRRELVPGIVPVYSSKGYLIYGPASAGEVGLRALPFSLEKLSALGEAFPIAGSGVVASVSSSETLAYFDVNSQAGLKTLAWRDRNGKILETISQPQLVIQFPSLSPDNQRIAVASNESGNADLWVHDLVRSTKTRLTFDAAREWTPVWSPSGTDVIYWHWPQGGASTSLRVQAANGTGAPLVVAKSDMGMPNPDWSRDGRYVVYQLNNGGSTQGDIRYVELDADGSASEPVTFLATPAMERSPKLSPDGRYIAYTSDESGHPEVYVRPFPDGAGKWQISVDGGEKPRWRSDGKELYYLQDNTTLMAVAVSTEQSVTMGQPQVLFQSNDLRSPHGAPPYDVSSDGQRFVTIASAEEDGSVSLPKVRIVQNWYEEFRDRKQ